MSNLINNALKFTDEGSVSIRLDLEGTETEPFVRFSVIDSGIGIPPESIGKVFESFSQADQSTTRKFGGTGLGLPICKNLAEAMGGEIGVTSVAGEGSTFGFTLPLKSEAKPVEVSANAGKRVIVGLPNNRTGEVIVEMLQRYTFEVICADPSEITPEKTTGYDAVIVPSATLQFLPQAESGQVYIAVTELGDSLLEPLVEKGQAHELHCASCIFNFSCRKPSSAL